MSFPIFQLRLLPNGIINFQLEFGSQKGSRLQWQLLNGAAEILLYTVRPTTFQNVPVDPKRESMVDLLRTRNSVVERLVVLDRIVMNLLHLISLVFAQRLQHHLAQIGAVNERVVARLRDQ